MASSDGRPPGGRPERIEQRESQDSERFRALTDHATELVAEFDENGRYLYASPSFQALLGIDPAELVGTVPRDLIHPDDRDRTTERFAAAVGGESESHSVHRLRHRDGSWRWFENTGRAYRTQRGELRFVSLGRDITERKQAEDNLSRKLTADQKLLQLSRHLLSVGARQLEKELVGSLSVAGELSDADRVYLVALRAAPDERADVYQWSDDDGPPARLEDLPWLMEEIRAGRVVHWGDAAELPALASRDREELARRGVGSLLGLPLRAGQHRIGMLCFERVRDARPFTADEVTLLSLAADVFAGSIDRLRTESALEESRLQLTHAQKMEAVGRLAGGIAHDFNNLLMVIGGFSASLARELPPDHPARGDAREIEHAVERAAKLTEQLLTLSRRQVVDARPVDLNTLVRGMREILSRLLGEDLSLEVQPEPRLPAVRVDTGQFEQALVNLAMNARNAMTTGGSLLVSTHTRRLDDAEAYGIGLTGGGDYVILGVRDTGCGMDAATQSRVFEPFFTTREPGQGTGLGLSIVYGLVQQWNGAINLWSRPGQGAMFRIYLPAVADEPQAPLHRETRSGPPGSETVLLVEDEAPVRRLLRRVLTQQGYRVFEARDGVEALEVWGARTGEIDLLVTDVVMPRMGGVALARRLRAEQPGLPVLFVSGHPEERTAGRTPEIVTGHFLQKPCSSRDLLAKMREILDAGTDDGSLE